MRERKFVELRVDMYEDTKFKIIDMKPERDLINYVWTRFITLAGKVNLEGELYLSKNIQYTMETLAIEFNRSIDQLKLALNVLMELEMIELTDDNIYRVKNFTKHQNIKVKEKNKAKDKEEDIKMEEALVKESSRSEIEEKNYKESEDKISQIQKESVKNHEIGKLEIIHKDINPIDENVSNDKNNSLKDIIPILLETKKSKRVNKKKKKDNNIDFIDEEIEENEMVCFYDDERHLGEGECIIKSWSF